jgi:hypothetical protein
MKSSTENGIKNNQAKCRLLYCAGCESCMAASNQDASLLKNEWKSSTQLYGAEAHSYDYYSWQLHNQTSVLNTEATV